MSSRNVHLIVGGVLSCIAALLHLAVIAGGAAWYRFFGAGETLATLAESGSLVPGLITFGIALVLFIWGLYAFSGARLIRPLPFMRHALVLISAIYLLRGLLVFPMLLVQPALVDAFAWWSSLICLVYGLFYAWGTRQIWRPQA